MVEFKIISPPLQTLFAILPQQQNKQSRGRGGAKYLQSKFYVACDSCSSRYRRFLQYSHSSKISGLSQKRFSKNARGAGNNNFPCCREQRVKRGESFRALSSLVFLWLLSENTESDIKALHKLSITIAL